MRVLGLVVDPKGGRPAVTAVLLEATGEIVSVMGRFEITSTSDDLPAQLDTLYESARTRVLGMLPVDVAVIRRADKARVPTDADGPRIRLLAEGALTAAVRSVVPDTRMCTGLELGRWDGSDKKTVDQTGTDLIAASCAGVSVGLGKRLSLAAAAALPALTRR